MVIGVVGMGYVGKLTAELLKRSHEVVMYDKFRPIASDVIGINGNCLGRLASKEAINEWCEATFVCVSTPEGKDGNCDLTAIDDVMKWLETPIKVIRSTVPPGTCKPRGAAHWPEFYGEWPTPILHGNPWEDITLLGGKDWERVADILKTCNPSRHKFVGYKDARITEIAKLSENAFLALKIELSNVLFDLCKNMGVSWEDVRNAWTLDPRIGADHTTVRESERGFKGKCLPKDTASLLTTAKRYNVQADIIEAMINSNKERIK